jgi:hypothetical protein
MEGITKEQFDDLVQKFGIEGARILGAHQAKIEADLNAKYQEVVKGAMTRADFDAYKNAQEQVINEKVTQITKLEDALKLQGTELLKLQEAPKGVTRSIEDFIEKDIFPQIPGLREKGQGNIAITGTQLKAAGITSIGGNSIATMAGSALTSPYLPGLGGTDLELFEIVRNPNWIINKVDLGRTNQVRLAWINETTVVGTDDVAGSNIAESGTKTLVQHKFQVEYSIAKKAAAYLQLTEEFDTDAPGLATAVRRMLEGDVMRAFDDAIQAAVIAAARPYEITGLTHLVDQANKYDALGAELAQVEYYNYVANTVAINPVTKWDMYESKNAVITSGPRDYIYPWWFPQEISPKLVTANKVAANYALSGDLKQYKVDIYKDFTLRVGWINDDFIKNQFVIVGELRYHAYISDNRKKAIVYDNLDTIIAAIRSGS